ncbi:cold shock domain-containing protein [Haloplanus rubicundus]
MPYQREGTTVVGDSDQCTFQVRQPYRRVLGTLSDETVPDGLVLVGILAGQLRPTTEAAAQRSQALVAAADDPPAATVTTQTAKSLQWLLHEIGDELPADRKQRIGTVIETAGLHMPSESATSPASQQCGINSGDPDSNDEPLPDSRIEVEDTTPEAGGSSFICEFCGAGFDIEGDLRSHWVGCDERPRDARFECPDCHNEYIAAYALHQHREDCAETDDVEMAQDPTQTEQSPTHRCADCGAVFDSRGSLRAHAFTCGGSEAGQRVVARGAIGTIVHYDSDGYGFISTPAVADDQDVFFHISDVPGTRCSEGTAFEFDIIETDDGGRAINISQRGDGPVDARPERFASDRAQWSRDT